MRLHNLQDLAMRHLLKGVSVFVYEGFVPMLENYLIILRVPRLTHNAVQRFRVSNVITTDMQIACH